MKDQLTLDFDTKPEDRIKELTKLIEHHNNLYYNNDTPEIPDSEYDKLVNELKDLEKKHPDLLSPTSPTQKVGGKAKEAFKKYTRNTPMLSLSNAFNKDDLIDFDKRIKRFLKLDENHKIEYYVEPKLDGLAIELIYKNGKFHIGATRGDGKTGEDVTQNIKTVKSIPKKINLNDFEVRGEVYIEKKDFLALNEERFNKGERAFANPRNAAAGSIRQLDSNITAKRPLKVILYAPGEIKGNLTFKSQKEFVSFLEKHSFPVNKLNKVCKNIDEVYSEYQKLEGMRTELPYEIDGFVVKVNDFNLQRELGEVSHHPRWATALKFKALEVETILEDIELSISRNGVVTPVARLKQVNVGGVMVSKATLHNKIELERKNLKIGDHVLIKRAGDVIPEVICSLPNKRTGKEKEFKFEKHTCPSCSSTLDFSDPVFVKCLNKSCKEKLKRKLTHFASKKAFNIDGLGPEQIDKFFDDNIIRTTSDLFKLEDKREDLTKREGLGEKSVQNLIDSINKSKNISADRYLFANGTDFIGSINAKNISDHYGPNKIKDIVTGEAKISPEDLMEIDGIGENSATSFFNFWNDETNVQEAKEHFKLGVTFTKNETRSSELNGLTFVITGTLPSLSRDDAKKLIESKGGKVTSSVSKKTSYVVLGESPGSKYEKAKKLGIKLLSEEELINLTG